MQNILVTAGTATLGRHFIPQLLNTNTGNTLRVLSRTPRQSVDNIHYLLGDPATGEGVNATVQDANIIVHCADSSTGR